MRITLFTCNQPRHMSLIHTLAEVADELFVVQETKTSFAGKREAVHPKSDVMEAYFARVMAAERQVFDAPAFSPGNAQSMALFMGDLSFFPLETFGPALDADVFMVFGASYIRGDLADYLVEKRCVNIHMGVSPYYRGSACNFWALYDGRPELVGATIHILSKGLDSGPILFHAMPRPGEIDGFLLGMQAVRAAHVALAERIRDGSVLQLDSVPQDRGLELRYTRSRDFTDDVAREYLDRLLEPKDIHAVLDKPRTDFPLKDAVFV